MSYSNDNHVFGSYYPSEDDTFEWYSFGADDQPIAGPSGSQDLHSNPPSEERVALSEYQGYTLLDEAGCHLTDQYASRTDYACDDFSTGMDFNDSYVQGQSIKMPTGDGGLSVVCPPASAGKGEARVLVTEDDVSQNQYIHITNTHGVPVPQAVSGVPPNTEVPSPVSPSHGPQRSKREGGRREATEGGSGKRSQSPTGTLPEGIDSSWEQTKDRFVWELLEEFYFRPAGRSIDPQAAFANIDEFIEEDLHRSPLADQVEENKAGGRSSRMYENYLTHIMKELRRSSDGKVPNAKEMFRQVLSELESELAPVYRQPVLIAGRSSGGNPDEVEASTPKGKHRATERARRTAIRDLQERMSTYFRVPEEISVGDLLLFVVVYLRIGPLAFPGLIRLLPPHAGQ